MHFIYPSFLFALFAVAIPVAIHLFNFRRYKKIYFSNVRFLEDVKKETRRQSQLRHLLVLLARILAVAALVFAFSQPYLPVKNKGPQTGSNLVCIYIDNSFSMEALSKNGMLLDVAKNKANEIAAAFRPSDEFMLITNDLELKHQRFTTKKELLPLISEIKLSPSTIQLSDILLRLGDFMNNKNNANKSIYAVSDFQKNSCNINEIKKDSAFTVFLVPVAANKTNNIYIDSCWFDSPIQQLNRVAALKVKIVNASDENLENLPIKLFINDQQRSLASVNIEARSEAEITLSYLVNSAGIQNGRIELSDNPVVYDDVFYFSYGIVETINVLCISGGSQSANLNALFGKDSLFVLVNVNDKNIDFSSFSKNNLILLNEVVSISSGLSTELQRFVYEGGSLVVIPPSNADLTSYKSFLISLNSDYYTGLDTANTKVSSINENHPVYREVFEKIPENVNFPVVNTHYKLSRLTNTSQEYLIRLQNGDNFFTAQSIRKGKLYLSAVPLTDDYSNFARNTLFVPTFYNSALMSTPLNPLFYVIGEDRPVTLRNFTQGSDEAFHIRSVQPGFDIIPEKKSGESVLNFFIHNQVKEAGNYYLASGNKNLSGLSFNYNRKESELDFYPVDDLKKQLEKKDLKNFSIISNPDRSLTDLITEYSQGIRLWKWFVILALLFLGAEVLLLRFMS
jgi:hypothetical protein